MKSCWRFLTCPLVAFLWFAALPSLVSGQAISVDDLQGDWVRTESNNHPWDGMRITLEGRRATLTFVPRAGSFGVGQVLWRNLAGDGAVEVRGSDGNYYKARLVFDGKYLHLDIDHTGAGHDQRWKRAGPSVDGDWVRIAPSDGAGRTKIRVAGGTGALTYLPATAPRRFRIGSKLWKDIGEGGVASVMGSDGRYVSARIALESKDRLRVDLPGRPSEVWVRPGAVEAATSSTTVGLPDPRPETVDRLTPVGDLPTVDRPETLPVSPATPAAACVATSLRHDGMGKSWDWSIDSPTNNDANTEARGLRGLVRGAYGGSLARYNVLTDVDRFRGEGMQDGHVYIWHPKGPDETTEQHVDLTSAEYHEKWEHYDAIGYIPTDIEAYMTAGGMRYAGIWARNDAGVDYWSQRNMTGEEYGTAFTARRGDGYRLVDMEAYSTTGGLRYAAIWVRSCDNSNWGQLRDMTRSVYQDSVESLAARGFRVVDFESYRTDGGQRYAAIWEKIPANRAWAVRTDRTLNWFLNYHKRYVDEGYRLVDFESYDTADGTRYAGVWAENEARHDYALRALLNDSIGDYRSLHGIVGMSVVVIKDGETIYRRGFGWADSSKARWAHSGTIYNTASIAKVIGGTLAARLHEKRSDFDVTRPTADYIEDLPDHHTHTVAQLLAKVGCINHYDEGPVPATNTYRWRVDALDQVWDTPLLRLNVDRGDWIECEPGDFYHYSTLGFTYVGAALEAVTGRDIAQLVEDELAKPFALTTLEAGPAGTGVPSLKGGKVRLYDLARGYRYDTTANQLSTANYPDNSWKVLGGGMAVSTMDLARFGWLTLNGSIVSASTRDNLLWNPVASDGMPAWPGASTLGMDVGLAWNLDTRNGKDVAEHGGAAGTARPHLRIYLDPTDQLVVAIMNNQGRSVSTEGYQPSSGLATQVARIVFNNPPPP